MEWLTHIVDKYPGWTLICLTLVLIAFAEALGEFGKRR